MKFKAVLFDLDGTLVDSQQDIYAALLKALAETGINAAIQDIARLRGAHLSLVLAHYRGVDVSQLDKNELAAFGERYRKHYWEHMFDNTRLFPGVIETLEKMSAMRKAVATAKPIMFADHLVDHYGLRKYFEVVQGCENLKPKPDPAVFIETCKRMKLEPAECLAAGDTSLDMISASSAGCATCLVAYQGEKADRKGIKPDYEINTFEGILGIVN